MSSRSFLRKPSSVSAIIVIMLILSSTLVALGMAGSVTAGWQHLTGAQNGYYYYYDSMFFGDTHIEMARAWSRNRIYTNPFTTSVPVTLIQISYYSGVYQKVRVGIYSDSLGSPRVKLAETSLDSVNGGAWHTFVISYSLPVGKYWFAFTLSGGGYGDVYAKYPGTDKYMAHTYDGTLPATYTVTGTQPFTYSLYATATG
jgi:hypothetical protein